MRYILTACLYIALCGFADWPETWDQVDPPPHQEQGSQLYPNQEGLLDPSMPDVYGPSVNQDGTGRPWFWQPEGTQDGPNPALEVEPNVFGPGIGMEIGRASCRERV